MAEVEDDRTEEQKATHYFGVAGTDRHMSGWGKARGGSSVAVWACKPDDRVKVWRYVQRRKDMKYPREVDLRVYRPGKNIGHVHIYFVDDEHPALV